jgi:hypothetical protein
LEEKEEKEEEAGEPAVVAVAPLSTNERDEGNSTPLRKLLVWLDAIPGDTIKKTDLRAVLDGAKKAERVCIDCDRVFVPSPSFRGRVCFRCRKKISEKKSKNNKIEKD